MKVLRLLIALLFLCNLSYARTIYDQPWSIGYINNNFWRNYTAQTGLTGDKTGSFVMTTSGEYVVTDGNDNIHIDVDAFNQGVVWWENPDSGALLFTQGATIYANTWLTFTPSSSLIDVAANTVKTTGDIWLAADDAELQMGDVATDSYVRFGGTNLEFYSSGAFDFGAGDITTSGDVTAEDITANGNLDVNGTWADGVAVASITSPQATTLGSGTGNTGQGIDFSTGIGSDEAVTSGATNSGDGGDLIITAGRGGALTGTNSGIYTTGKGGGITLTTGAGGVSDGEFIQEIRSEGAGDFSVVCGSGNANTIDNISTGTGGTGGSFTLTAGGGGNVVASGSATSGDGGAVSLTSGSGGTADGAAGGAGDGGDFTIKVGVGGSGIGVSNGADGRFYLKSGLTTIFQMDEDQNLEVIRDDGKLGFGAAGIADSYIQWGGSNLEFYSAGNFDFQSNTLMGVSSVADGSSSIAPSTAWWAAGSFSVHAFNRYLYASDGSDVILDWSTAGTAQFNDSDITTTGILKSLRS